MVAVAAGGVLLAVGFRAGLLRGGWIGVLVGLAARVQLRGVERAVLLTVLVVEGERLESFVVDHVAVRVHADAVRARQPSHEVVEAAVLHHHADDVLDRRASFDRLQRGTRDRAEVHVGHGRRKRRTHEEGTAINAHGRVS